MYPWQLLIGFLPDHDSSQISSVGGQTEKTEDGPEVHQQPTSPALWRLDGHCSPKEDGVAHIKGWREREDTVAVAPTGCHPKGAVPLIQGEEDGGDMEGDKDAEPHGPVERPHEGADGRCSVTSTNLGRGHTGWKNLHKPYDMSRFPNWWYFYLKLKEKQNRMRQEKNTF